MGGGGSKARAAEANARAAEAQAKAQAHAATQARLKAEYEAQSKERLKQMEMEHQKQESERAAAREREKQQHLERLKEMERLREQKNKELKIEQRNNAINECKEQISKCDNNINKTKEHLEQVTQDFNDKTEKVNVLDEKINNFDTYRGVELEKVSTAIGLPKARSDFERVDKEIKAAIDLTSVHEDNIANFLTLTQQLLNATLSNQEQANKLSAELETFGELIKRAGSGKLSIEQYFSDSNMDRFIPILAEEELTNMNDLICEGDEKDEEFTEIKELITEGILKQHEQWEEEKKEFESNPDNDGKKFPIKEPKTKLAIKQRKFLEKACLYPENWQTYQTEKIEVTKKALNDISPLLGSFFDKIHVTMKQAQLLLTYSNNDGNLTDDQQKAIQMAAHIEDVEISNPSEVKDDEKSDINDNDNDDMPVITDAPDVSDIAPSAPKENELELMKKFDSSGQKMFEQSMALNKAAIHSINIIDEMKEEFEESPNSQRALGLAQGIEGTCMEIVRSIGTIRQSLILGHCILKMKPANLTERSKKLWNAVDGGLIQIFDNALKMSKVSANYFGFFLKFKQSFNYYLAAKDKSLLISTEHLQTDIIEFKKLSDTFGKQVSLLGDSAMKCIEECIRNTAGAENFEKNRTDREEKLKTYLEKKKIYDKRVMELDAQYGELLDKRADLKAKKSSLELVIDSLKRQIEFDINLRDTTQQTMDQLNQIII